VSSAGSEAVDLAASVGLYLTPWQQWVLDQGLSEDASGKWAAFEVALIVARQNGKNAVLEALELAALFLFGDRLIVHSAHQFATAFEHFLRM
jgi:phage terminase large subunit-like protein